MSVQRYTTSLLYLNIGGEMLYVLQQRLHAQNIPIDKTVLVLNEVIYAFLNTVQIQQMFAQSHMCVAEVRPYLEHVVHSSIMKLSENSMDKLFDLITAMVKFQLTCATGPREIMLITLNHLDYVKAMVTSAPELNEFFDLTYKLIINNYGNLTHDEMWQLRQICLQELDCCMIKVSVLLKLGYQNEDSTFNSPVQDYNERYEERKDIIGKIKLVELTGDEFKIGSLAQKGMRKTMLGTNIITSTRQSQTSSGLKESDRRKSSSVVEIRSDETIRRELDLLAKQLGTDQGSSKRPISLFLFSDSDESKSRGCDESRGAKSDETNDISVELHKKTDDETVEDNNVPQNSKYKEDLMKKFGSDFDETDGKISPVNIFSGF